MVCIPNAEAFKDQWAGTAAPLPTWASCIMKSKCIGMYQRVNRILVLYKCVGLCSSIQRQICIYVCTCACACVCGRERTWTVCRSNSPWRVRCAFAFKELMSSRTHLFLLCLKCMWTSVPVRLLPLYMRIFSISVCDGFRQNGRASTCSCRSVWIRGSVRLTEFWTPSGFISLQFWEILAHRW